MSGTINTAVTFLTVTVFEASEIVLDISTLV